MSDTPENNSNTLWIVIGLVVVVAVIVLVMCWPSKDKSAPESAPEKFSFSLGDTQAPLFRGSQPNMASYPVYARSPLPQLNSISMYGQPQMYNNFATQPVKGININYFPPQETERFAFEDMGGVAKTAEFVEGGYGGAASSPTDVTTGQVNAAFQDTMNGGKPDMFEPQLPLCNIDSDGTDPTNSENFMYDRTIFAPLKRRYANGVDFFRGDIHVKQQNRGWFDISPATEKDIVTGYFDRYIDIQQETAIRDANFTRSGVTPEQAVIYANSTANNEFVAYRDV
jgi:hypothetical protein